MNVLLEFTLAGSRIATWVGVVLIVGALAVLLWVTRGQCVTGRLARRGRAVRERHAEEASA